MNKKGLGFLTSSGAIAALLTVLVVAGVGWLRGGILFSPGPLNAKTGGLLGGVRSHAELGGRCKSCHTAFWVQTSMSDRCVACHASIAAQLKDPSSLHGLFQGADPGQTCWTCHPDHKGPEAPATILESLNFPHEALGYALTAHKVKDDNTPFTCVDCHGRTFNAEYDQAVCTTCHQQMDPDFMRAHLQAYAEGCLGCHDGVDSYGHAFDHLRVPFQLTGKHASLDCGPCHTGARTIADLMGTPQECFSCHAKDDAHQGQLGTACASCHATGGWLPVTFDHDSTSFKLTGKHVGVPCTSCHVNAIIKCTPADCYSCHARDDRHRGLFGTACHACHNTNGWLPATFDHSRFPLTSGHGELTCTRCHKNEVFTGLSTTCAACHADPAFHAGLFAGVACNACHSIVAWIPASYEGPHPGGCEGNCISHEGAACRDCHTDNLATATCLKCHDSNNPGDGNSDD